MGEQNEKSTDAAEVNVDGLNRTTTASDVEANSVNDNSSRTKARRLYIRLRYVPPRCRYDPKKPFQFSIGLNILFGRPVASLES